MTLVKASAMILVFLVSALVSTRDLKQKEETMDLLMAPASSRTPPSHCSNPELISQWFFTHQHSSSSAEAGCEVVSHLLSMMLLRRLSRWLSRWETVKAGKRRMAKRSCSHASMSSARFIFLCTTENFTSGNWLATT